MKKLSHSLVKSIKANKLIYALVFIKLETPTFLDQAPKIPVSIHALVSAFAKYINENVDKITKLCIKLFFKSQDGHKVFWKS